MSTLESIFQWVQNDLAEWQSDAVRRLWNQGELTERDRTECLTMLKARHGLTDPTELGPNPQPLRKVHMSGAPSMPTTVTVKALQDLRNVNAVPDGSHLYFGHQGLSVVYGENGSGKSAYARVLKKACKARDTKERILPNAFGGATTDPARATIKISVNGGPDEYLAWEDGQEASDTLSSICVFDSRCARVILDENNEPTYLPYGADVFEGLVDLMKDLRTRLEAEKPKLEKLEYVDILPTTKAGQFISQLSQETLLSVVEEKTTWTKENDLKLGNLNSEIAAAEALDPRIQAQRIRNLKDSLDVIIDCIVEIEWTLSESNASSLREEICRLPVLENAAEIASKTSFATEPLAGVGSSPWQVLYNAAREYSIQVAYPDRDFPVLDNEALCVLCMQPFQEDTKARMAKFKAFMEGATKRQLDTATEGIQKKRRSLEQTTFPPTEMVKSVVDEIRNRNEQLAKQTEAYLTAMQERRNHMIQSIADKQPEAYPPADRIAVECLVKVSDQFEKEAQDIEETAKPEELAAKKNERDGLLAWKLVSQKKQDIVTYVTQLKTSVRYNKCIAETAFKHITDRGRDIISAALTDRLIEALGRELKNLNASYLPLNLRPSGVEGETRYRMELTGSCLAKADLSEILSEGEQHVVAIAGFLAELGIRDHKCPIVLDDPVCSLDHQYRDKVAERLAKEAITRQVIVFTHDIAFLLELQHSAAEQGAYFHIQTVARHGNTPGDCSEGAPWHAMSVLDRIKHLKKELNNFEGLYGIDWGQYNQKASYLYGLLRETWEAAVEEELLFKTIRRHGNEVQTKRLAQVEVTTSDYVEIESQIGRCSTWMVGHDKSRALNVNRPSPDEIRRDIQSLDTFRSNIRNQGKRLNEEREQALQTRRPSVD